MKIRCSKTNLMKGINIVSKAVPSKTTMTILECILVEAQMGRILFTANDLELGIETEVEGIIEERGTVALDAKMFAEIIRKLPENDVTIETDSMFKTVITCEQSTFQIMGKDGDDFSPLPEIEKEEPIILSQFSLKEMVRQTIFAISQNDTNKVMTGELVEIVEDKMRMIALDGHRIAIRKVALGSGYEPAKVIVPGKTLSEVSKILSGETADLVSLYVKKNHLLFEFDQTRVVSRLIEGSYFRVDQMISNDYETKISVNRKELAECVDRSTLLLRENDKKPILLDIKDGEMELRMKTDAGSLDEKMAVQKEGKDILIGFNPKFMMDALRVIDDEMIDLYFINSKAPCVIRNFASDYVYLILPVNFIN